MNSRRILVVAAAGLCAAVWTYACGDGATEPPIPPPDPLRPATVAVAPATVQFTALGATEQLTAEVRDQNGNAMAGAAVSWTSSAATVATVSASGLVTATGNGTATITATAGSASGTATVTVAQEVSAVAVTPPTDTLVAADTLRLSAEATDATGHPMAEVEFSWTSSDTLVAVVDAAGLVTGVGAGEAAVTATAAGVTGRAALTVVAPAPTTVAVTPDTAVLTALGQTAQLAAEVQDQIGRVIEGVPVSWSSADRTVAEVDSAGLVTAIGGGTTAITATAGAVSGAAVVAVMQSAGSVVVSPAADTVALGDTLRLVAEAFDENGHRIEGGEFRWSSSDVSVARVDGSGLVEGVAEGTATITAAAGDELGASRITVENPDRAALVALYNATGGPSWVNSDNWLTDAPLRDWHGVDTDDAGRVVGVEFLANTLSGPLPAELGNLSSLTTLTLRGNNLGPIPPELGNLTSLTTLDLVGNRLTGPIPPELGNLTRLTTLNFYLNDLRGPIPAELGNLTSLEVLDLPSNKLSGPIPAELGNLTSLTTLTLSLNYLSGPIPPELGNLKSLKELWLLTNNLTGPIPPQLGNLSSLKRLFLPGNNLSGPIPRSFLELDELQEFLFSDNAGLCAPGTSAFVGWMQGMEELPEGPYCNESDMEVLELVFETSGGPNWTSARGWLEDPLLDEWYGVTADSLGRVVVLDLARNGLEGPLPPSLGSLAELTTLRVGGNALAGRLPRSLARLALVEFDYAGTSLCVPAEASFEAWLNGIASHQGTGVVCDPLSDREILVGLYEATGGPAWTNADNWLSAAPIRDWHGVVTDSANRVVRLDLSGNNLSGPIPAQLGDLASLRRLRLGFNDLVGPIPPELGDLTSLELLLLEGAGLVGSIPPELGNLSALETLDLGENTLTGPIPPEFGNLASLEDLRLQRNDLSGPIPPELGDLTRLTELLIYENDLVGHIPPELGDLTRLTALLGERNTLTGSIPPELGNLTSLQSLDLRGNTLTGSIPSELGNLAGLRRLRLDFNDLSGPIPPELGNLASLYELHLDNNRLSGPILPELGDLVSLEDLRLQRNDLSGPIPPELGNLAGLRRLWLERNDLSGPIPPELGKLTSLEELYLDNNGLSGPVPPEFGGMSSLRQLSFANNSGMSGALPAGLTALPRLQALTTVGTDLCAPRDPGFQAWSEGLQVFRVAACADGDVPVAYLTQAVQSPKYPVPLVAGEKALLRVFVTAAHPTTATIPPVRARFYLNGRESHVADIPGTATAIPSEVAEYSLSKSANAEIPGQIVQPGLEMVIEIDPDGTLDPGLGVARRIPETGRTAVDARELPVFDLTVIPFLWSADPDSAVLEAVEGMAADPEGHELLWDTRTLLPIGDLEVEAHEPVVTSSNNPYAQLAETRAIRAMEGGSGYYMGMNSDPFTGGIAGLASGPASFARLVPSTIAHEIGHNLSLKHAPCGASAFLDPFFPYWDGRIGVWGYDFDAQRLVPPEIGDLMSYCDPSWISDYSFTNALRYRLRAEDPPMPAATSLLLWGGMDAEGEPFLNPAFVVDSPPALPAGTGEHQIVGRTATGDELFAIDFGMLEVADGDGSSSFVFVLPVQPGWADNLSSITLSGPRGLATLDTNSDMPMSILLDPNNGKVRGILRDVPQADAATTLAQQAGPDRFDVLFSRGLPGAAAWRR